MPDWCQNRVTFSGDAEQIKEIRELFANDEPFQKILPLPHWCDWHSWRTDNWGTKWDIRPEDVSFDADDENYLQIEFDTAWAPAKGICYKLREKYKEVDIIWLYYEPGMQLFGCL